MPYSAVQHVGMHYVSVPVYVRAVAAKAERETKQEQIRSQRARDNVSQREGA